MTGGAAFAARRARAKSLTCCQPQLTCSAVQSFQAGNRADRRRVHRVQERSEQVASGAQIGVQQIGLDLLDQHQEQRAVGRRLVLVAGGRGQTVEDHLFLGVVELVDGLVLTGEEGQQLRQSPLAAVFPGRGAEAAFAAGTGAQRRDGGRGQGGCLRLFGRLNPDRLRLRLVQHSHAADGQGHAPLGLGFGLHHGVTQRVPLERGNGHGADGLVHAAGGQSRRAVTMKTSSWRSRAVIDTLTSCRLRNWSVQSLRA